MGPDLAGLGEDDEGGQVILLPRSWVAAGAKVLLRALALAAPAPPCREAQTRLHPLQSEG